MKYYISDLHLLHENAIKYDHRPFDSIQLPVIYKQEDREVKK